MTNAKKPITPEELARRDRVRIVRRLSKWLTKYETISSDAARLAREGVTIPEAWGFGFAPFFEKSNAMRKYLVSALAAATEPQAPTAGENGSV